MRGAVAAGLLAVACAAVATDPAPLRVVCSSDGPSGRSWRTSEVAPPSPFSTLQAARDALRAAERRGSARPTVVVSGTCHGTLALGPEDAGTRWVGVPGGDGAQIVGGTPLPASAFAPVTDPAIVAQIQPAARPFVMQVDLAALGIPAGPGPISGRGCREYAEGLPQPHSALGSMPSAEINSPVGLELFALSAPGDEASAPSPLILARWPNEPNNPYNWSVVRHNTAPGQPRVAVPDNPTLLRASGWLQQFAEDAGSIMVHQYNRVGWADMHWPVLDIGLIPGRTFPDNVGNFTWGGCGNMSVGEHYIQDGNYFTTYNLLSELDVEGEFYVNRTSMKLYAWLPSPSAAAVRARWEAEEAGAERELSLSSSSSSSAGAAATRAAIPDPVVAFASLTEAPLVTLTDTHTIDFAGISFRYGRGPGLTLVNSSSITVQDGAIEAVGLMAVNVTDGTGLLLQNVSIADTGNGGVYLYAGDRATLAPSNHTLTNTTITRYNRWTHCYTPGVVLGGVGNVVGPAVEIFDAPHQAIFLSGNNHLMVGLNVHDVTKITADAGAIYFGRDLTYRGNVVVNSSFHDINSFFAGTPVIYADDCGSSISVLGCTFRNCSGPVAALEGGKDHVFRGNVVTGCNVGHGGVHAVGKSCASSLPYLALVPWNTSAAWAEAYPTLVPEVEQSANDPWHLVFVGNTICLPQANATNATNTTGEGAFADASEASVVQYNGTDAGNVVGVVGVGVCA
jgi:hypothetical protein